MNNIGDALIYGRKRLKDGGIASYALDSRLLLCHVLKVDNLFLLMHNDFALSAENKDKYLEMLERRLNGVPLAYLTNEKEFMSLMFYVDENVLIPRPDTEILTEFAIKTIRENGFKIGLEIGAGSGAVSVSVCKYCEQMEMTAVDISEEALSVAERNAASNGVENRLVFFRSDLFGQIPPFKYDIIVSNPPYIKTTDMESLSDDVKTEPELALHGGLDGLDFYKRITAESVSFLADNGVIAYEIGFDQAAAVKDLLASFHFTQIEVLKDLSGLDRVVAGKWKEQ